MVECSIIMLLDKGNSCLSGVCAIINNSVPTIGIFNIKLYLHNLITVHLASYNQERIDILLLLVLNVFVNKITFVRTWSLSNAITF